jgi:class 3 adenylate cyclase
MFTDIVGFTALSEKLGPEALGELLGQLLGEVADLSMKHGATVDKFIGDCVMVVFGAPEPMPPKEQATRCVNLALAIHERIKSLGDQHDLHARTGINTGEVVVGNFGSMARSDYTVLGPTVNIAARLESHSEPDCILIGPQTADSVQGLFELETAGPLSLKGVSHPVESFFVIGKKR